jgi:hypothetical protein
MGMKVGRGKNAIIVKEYILDIATVQVFDNYMVAVYNEGCTVTLERAYQIIGISEIHFRDKPFGFISLRKNSYALDPTIYNYVRELDNLKAYAIVSVKEMDMHNFTIEKMFYKKPMKFFIDYNNALTWVKKKIKASKKK